MVTKIIMSQHYSALSSIALVMFQQNICIQCYIYNFKSLSTLIITTKDSSLLSVGKKIQTTKKFQIPLKLN